MDPKLFQIIFSKTLDTTIIEKKDKNSFYSVKTWVFKSTVWYYILYGDLHLWLWNCSGIVGDGLGVKAISNEEFS